MFTQESFPHSGLRACDYAGQFTSLLVMHRDSQTLPDRYTLSLTGPQAMEDTGPILSERLWEAFRRSLSPRQSRHRSAPRVTATVAVQMLLPPQVGKTAASVTALLTFPMVESILLKDIHVTWIFHLK